MERPSVSGAFALALLAILASGCGAPSEGTRAIGASDVPYRLLSPSPPAPPTESPPGPDDVSAQVYFVGPDDFLVGVPYAVEDAGPTAEIVRAVLDQLSQGPGDSNFRLGTAIRPDVTLELVDIGGTTARIAISTPAREPSPDQLPLAVGQIVLTVTSLPGVSDVVILTDGHEVDIPLPGGQLTQPPVSGADYQELLRVRPVDEPTAA